MKLSIRSNHLEKFSSIYLFIVILNALPILVFKYFPTSDGPAHLYNSNLLKEILLNKNAFIAETFEINNELIPNWTSHIILLIFKLFLPAFLADKLFLLIYAVGFPMLVLILVKQISPQNEKLSLLILPFVYTFLFGLGFYNFSLGIVLILLTVNLWLKWKQRFSFWRVFILFLVISMVYFTHIFIFGILLLVLISLAGFDILFVEAEKRKKTYFAFGVLFIILMPYIFLTIRFLSVRDSFESQKLPVSDLIKHLKDVRSLIIYNYERELRLTEIISYLYFGLVIISLYNKFVLYFKTRDKSLLFSGINNNKWLLISFIILVLYFILPDSSSGAGYISQRLNIFFFITLIIWITTQKYPRWLVNFSITVILITNFSLTYRYFRSVKNLNKEAVEFSKAVKVIEENSIILPIKNSDSWLDGHFSNYLGIDKSLIILENYEANTGYFPITWNNEIPVFKVGKSNIQSECVSWMSGNNLENYRIVDYIVIWGNRELNSCMSEFLAGIEKEYKLIYSSENSYVKLYKFN